MTVLKKANSILKKFKRDESGAAALTWALSLTAILGAVGASMDFAVLSAADARSQSIADSTALAAAIYVKTHGRPPTEQGELTEGNHTAASLDFDYKSFVVNGPEGVNININYDDDAKEITTTVTGKTNPILVQLLGFKELEFGATSVASYLDIQNTFPASIALVLDNSGSMQFDDKLPINLRDVTHARTCQRWRWSRTRGWYLQSYDCSYTHKHGDRAPGAEVRLNGLKASVIKFQTELSNRLGVQDDSSRKTIRMGMLPYSSAIISSGQQPMDWGYLDEGLPSHVNNNSNPNDDVENAQGIYGMKADGGTNSSPPMSEARSWLESEDAIHSQEAARAGVPDDKDPLKFVIFMTDGQNTVGNWDVIQGPTGQWHKEISNDNWDTVNWAKSGYTEGTLTLMTDTETAASCQAMKNQGVKIFTIGYALEDHGHFRVNGWANREHDSTYWVSSGVRGAAYALMQSCASTEDHFIKAADASQLEAAFDEIQNAIVEELIRLKS